MLFARTVGPADSGTQQWFLDGFTRENPRSAVVPITVRPPVASCMFVFFVVEIHSRRESFLNTMPHTGPGSRVPPLGSSDGARSILEHAFDVYSTP